MERAQVIYGNCHLWNLLKKFTMDFVNYHKLVTVLQISALYVVDQHSMCTALVVVVQSA